MEQTIPPSTEKKESQTSIQNGFVDIETMFEGMTQNEKCQVQDKIYEDYVNAMRMRNREPLEEQRFYGHFFDGGNFEQSITFGSIKDGYLLGSDVNGVFVPTHFAPSGLRQGYRLIKELMSADRPTALFITQDLVDTIQKMKGWKILPFRIKTYFRSDVIEKILVVSQWSALRKLASHHLVSIVKDKLSGMEWRASQLGEKAKNLLRHPDANADDLNGEIKAYIENNEIEDYEKEELPPRD